MAREGIVFVVDDDRAVRESLDSLLRAAGWEVEVFATASQFLLRQQVAVPHCLLLDVEMPVVGGLELQERMLEQYRATPILFITGHGDIPTTVRAMKAGAVEFLTKPLVTHVVMETVERAMASSKVSIARDAEQRELVRRHGSLTPREKEVMDKVAMGLLNKEIASDLGITEGTVKLHRAQVMHKMQTTSLADLVKVAERLTR